MFSRNVLKPEYLKTLQELQRSFRMKNTVSKKDVLSVLFNNKIKVFSDCF